MAIRARFPSLFVGLAIVAGVGVPRSARADAADDAKKLFDDAMKNVDAKEYSTGCPKLETVVKMLPGKVGATIELARCYDKWGKKASAWRAYQRVIDLAPKNDSRLFEAKKRHDDLGKKLPTVRIDVPQAVADLPGLEIDRDGVAVDAGVFNHDDPSDTGHFAFTATATGKKPWTGAIDVSESGSVTVSVPMLDDMPKAVAPPPPPPPPRRPLWPAGVGYGVTAVLLGVGIGSLVAANKAPNVECPVGGCPAGDAFQKNQNLMSNLSLGSFIGAGVAAGASTGLLIWAVSGKHPAAGDADHASLRVLPSLSPTFTGAVAAGAF